LNVTIRPAILADAAGCAAIYAPYVRDSWVSFETEAPDADEMAQRIAEYGASHAWLVAQADDGIAGYAYASPHRIRAAYSTSVDVAIYVDPAYARQSVGKRLYEALFSKLKDAGYHAAFAGIVLPNDGSIALHRAVGFTPVGIYKEVGWKMGAWRDTSWWQRLL
jgi:L-amino acid N-acyltransferase YncA